MQNTAPQTQLPTSSATNPLHQITTVDTGDVVTIPINQAVPPSVMPLAHHSDQANIGTVASSANHLHPDIVTVDAEPVVITPKIQQQQHHPINPLEGEEGEEEDEELPNADSEVLVDEEETSQDSVEDEENNGEEEEEEEEEEEQPKEGDQEPSAESMIAHNSEIAEKLKTTIAVDPAVVKEMQHRVEGNDGETDSMAAASSLGVDHVQVVMKKDRKKRNEKSNKKKPVAHKEKKGKIAPITDTKHKGGKKKQTTSPKGKGPTRNPKKEEEEEEEDGSADEVVEEEDDDIAEDGQLDGMEEDVEEEEDGQMEEEEDAEDDDPSVKNGKKKKKEEDVDSDEGEGDEMVRRSNLICAIKEYKKTVPNGPVAEIAMSLPMLRQIKNYYKQKASEEVWTAAFAYAYTNVIGIMEMANERWDICRKLTGMSLKLRGAKETVESNLVNLNRPMHYYGKKIAKSMAGTGVSPMGELIMGTFIILKSVHTSNVQREAMEALNAAESRRHRGRANIVHNQQQPADTFPFSDMGHQQPHTLPEFVPQQVFKTSTDEHDTQHVMQPLQAEIEEPGEKRKEEDIPALEPVEQPHPDVLDMRHADTPRFVADGGEPIALVHSPDVGVAGNDDVASSASAEEGGANVHAKGKMASTTTSASSSSSDDDSKTATTATSVYKIDMGGASGKKKKTSQRKKGGGRKK